jgi:hypothetical protein
MGLKKILAVKVKDGWSMVVVETFHLYSKIDVLKLIRQNNLKICKENSNDEKIFADQEADNEESNSNNQNQ